MILQITSKHEPATDLGYLLHKNPARTQTFPLAFGNAHVVYSQATVSCCSCALILDIDPVGLVRRGFSSENAGSLTHYVNDRPYVASSYLSVAIAQVFSSAMAGRSKDRPELAQTAIPLEASIDVLPCRYGIDFIKRLFEPLGYAVQAKQYPLDEQFPEWGDSSFFSVTLIATITLSELLTHLYVLIPTLDNAKHYAIGDDEVEKLIEKGEGWLPGHPEKEIIAAHYLKHRRSLIREALDQLNEEDVTEADDNFQATPAQNEAIERKVSLHNQRILAVLAALKESGAKTIIDLGCGEGKLIAQLLRERQFTNIVGMDVSYRSLETAQERLRLDRLPSMQRERITLIQGSLIYRDKRLGGFDAAALVEVIEHLDPSRLAAFERVVFEFAHPKFIVLTTPNSEYNVKFETLPEGQMRHKDHRFEWSRDEFRTWSNTTAERFGYRVKLLPIGEEDEKVGPPSQMAIFEAAS